MTSELIIDITLVRALIATQFRRWAELPIRIAKGGWDNRSFRLGEHMLVRMPSAAEYVDSVEKEHKWLPKLAPFLPLSIPEPLAMGKPSDSYPWKWSIYRYLEGETIASRPIDDLCEVAMQLAQFLVVLQSIDATGGPLPGVHSFYRGGSLKVYDAQVHQAIIALKDKINVDTAIDVWETALTTSWENLPVWVHGDISMGNLLVKEGRLSAVIDFGQLAIGDPACDLAIAWTLFEPKSRENFCKSFSLDRGTWARGRAWALWKALIVAAGFTNSNNAESAKCQYIIKQVLADHRRGT